MVRVVYASNHTRHSTLIHQRVSLTRIITRISSIGRLPPPLDSVRALVLPAATRTRMRYLLPRTSGTCFTLQIRESVARFETFHTFRFQTHVSP